MSAKQFNLKKETRNTMNFIGLCLHTPMTPEAEKNIKKWIENRLDVAYLYGRRGAIDEATEEELERSERLDYIEDMEAEK